MIGGFFDTLLSPKKSAEDWLGGQRAAINHDLAYQRAIFVAQIREVASEATTEAAIKLAMAGVVTCAVVFVAYRLATHGGHL